jgi:hypothetical protein
MNNKDYRPFSASIYTFFNDFEDNNPGYGLIPMHVRMLAVYLCTAPDCHKSGLLTVNLRAIHLNMGLNRELVFPSLEQLAEIPYQSPFRNYSGGFAMIENGKMFIPFIADISLHGNKSKWFHKNIYQPLADETINAKQTPNIFNAFCEFWNEEIYQYQEGKKLDEEQAKPEPQQPKQSVKEIIAQQAEKLALAGSVNGTSATTVPTSVTTVEQNTVDEPEKDTHIHPTAERSSNSPQRTVAERATVNPETEITTTQTTTQTNTLYAKERVIPLENSPPALIIANPNVGFAPA